MIGSGYFYNELWTNYIKRNANNVETRPWKIRQESSGSTNKKEEHTETVRNSYKPVKGLTEKNLESVLVREDHNRRGLPIGKSRYKWVRRESLKN